MKRNQMTERAWPLDSIRKLPLVLRRRVRCPTLYASLCSELIRILRTKPQTTSLTVTNATTHYFSVFSMLNGTTRVHVTVLLVVTRPPVVAWTRCFSVRTRRTCGCEGETRKRCVARSTLGVPLTELPTFSRGRVFLVAVHDTLVIPFASPFLPHKRPLHLAIFLPR